MTIDWTKPIENMNGSQLHYIGIDKSGMAVVQLKDPDLLNRWYRVNYKTGQSWQAQPYSVRNLQEASKIEMNMTNSPFEAGKTYNLRGGGTAEILKVGSQIRSGETIFGLRTFENGDQDVGVWFSSGNYDFTGDKHECDLLPPEPERVSLWMNVYPYLALRGTARAVYDSRELADHHMFGCCTHVLELIYEDGIFVDVIKHKVGE